MTRANAKPVRRIVQSATMGELVIEVYADHLHIRQYRRRKGGVSITWGSVYLRGLWVQEDLNRREKRKGKAKRVARGRRF